MKAAAANATLTASPASPASPASRLARFWQIVRREATRAVMLHVEACGMMAELYRRSGR